MLERREREVVEKSTRCRILGGTVQLLAQSAPRARKRSLVDEWKCDASNATWIVDRLENFDLAERRNVPRDRRVELVILTADVSGDLEPDGDNTG